MRHLGITLLLILLNFGARAQEPTTLNMYEFQIKTITEPAVAKGVIAEIRELLTVKTVYFFDETDTFRIIDPQVFSKSNIKQNLASVGLIVKADVVIVNNYTSG